MISSTIPEISLEYSGSVSKSHSTNKYNCKESYTNKDANAQDLKVTKLGSPMGRKNMHQGLLLGVSPVEDIYLRRKSEIITKNSKRLVKLISGYQNRYKDLGIERVPYFNTFQKDCIKNLSKGETQKYTWNTLSEKKYSRNGTVFADTNKSEIIRRPSSILNQKVKSNQSLGNILTRRFNTRNARNARNATNVSTPNFRNPSVRAMPAPERVKNRT
ncbi:hypothetical protein AX774_g353 [Zancudomyces culisetae]|uniref:Uncharacterized protein n=1 Tax=Zancudomyces culisetae TaxID=1213189 RepID=A0A1R1PYP7_ZANCU|nr:hypothetical protein AX774_g353 [Zancudomyces culisetae]|eukprot:OMH86075.1 hypothetical protein AX774_g353 [Zancudomyces culisetae]